MEQVKTRFWLKEQKGLEKSPPSGVSSASLSD